MWSMNLIKIAHYIAKDPSSSPCSPAIIVLQFASWLSECTLHGAWCGIWIKITWPFMVVWAHIVRCRVSTVPLDNQLANYNTHAHLERVRGSDTWMASPLHTFKRINGGTATTLNFMVLSSASSATPYILTYSLQTLHYYSGGVHNGTWAGVK